ncbi:hypothetical protein [Halomarina litorea]|uniref:hypothetical protein n=1 Tax=Halomarina litorea TaxID=2961595 RepID=UPI0034A1F889
MSSRPQRCPTCNRTWIPSNPRSDGGYQELGAYVWKYTNCDSLFKISDPHHQSIAWRQLL